MSLRDKIDHAWILTDGKAGDLVQCRGVAECLGLEPEIRIVSPRPPFVWLMPRGPIDPREAPGSPGSPIAPPFPDIALASGRRTLAYLRHVKRASRGRTFTVFLKDPRIGAQAADFIWVPEHDRLRGPNVMATPTSPHLVRPSMLARLRLDPRPDLAALPAPRLTVLLGGPSAAHAYDDATIARFAAHLRLAASQAGSVLMSPSRRTSPALMDAAMAAIDGRPAFVWDGAGENPYAHLLALADALLVTGDSVNMVGEALAAGRPVHLFRPRGHAGRVETFLDTLLARGIVRDFRGQLEFGDTKPIDSTPEIAQNIAERFRARKSAGPFDAPRRPTS